MRGTPTRRSGQSSRETPAAYFSRANPVGFTSVTADRDRSAALLGLAVRRMAAFGMADRSALRFLGRTTAPLRFRRDPISCSENATVALLAKGLDDPGRTGRRAKVSDGDSPNRNL